MGSRGGGGTPNQALDPGINEKWLLHGTKPQTVVPILEKGLSGRLSGGAFGSGVYLTENAEKMDQYTFPDLPDSAPAAGLEELHSILYGTGEDSIGRPDEDVFYAFVVLACCGLPVRTKDGLTDLDRPGSDIFRHAG